VIPLSCPLIGRREKELVSLTVETNRLTFGPMNLSFEAALSTYLKGKPVVATSSGTAALHLVLAALGIGPGDEVLVPALTYVATANAVRYVGATPVLVDVDPKTWTMSFEKAQARLSRRTKAAIPVHLYGVPCDMRLLAGLGVPLIEDAAEGFGGTYGGKPLGTLGVAGTLSFYGNKIVTTGEGGAVVSSGGEFSLRMRHLRGQAMTSRRYFHDEVGFNFRMTEMQAALGIGQMSHIDAMMLARESVILQYYERLHRRLDVDFQGMPAGSGNSAAPWLFTMLVDNREGLMKYLEIADIETRPTFVPLHHMPMYHGHDSAFPEATRIGARGISLPTFAGMKPSQVSEVCDRVIEWLDSQKERVSRAS